jgi:hypothetical protein
MIKRKGTSLALVYENPLVYAFFPLVYVIKREGVQLMTNTTSDI